jgi:hypothetical protein
VRVRACAQKEYLPLPVTDTPRRRRAHNVSAAYQHEPGVSQHDRAVAHRDAALAAIAKLELLKRPSAEQILGIALTHALLSIEARIEEMTELAPR